jgi:hypothetical protein
LRVRCHNVRTRRFSPNRTKTEFAVKKQLEHAATVRFDSELWQRVERLAADQRRPISHLIRNLVEDAVAGQASGDTPTSSRMVAA